MIKLTPMLEKKRITSRENRRLVHARKVRDGREPGQIFIEGRRLAAEAFGSGINIRECFISDDLSDKMLVDSILRSGAEVAVMSPSLFRSISATEHPQGIVLLADRPLPSLVNFDLNEVLVPVYLYLHEINNPANLGAILRTAEASGSGGVFISKRSADVFSPKSLRASMGAAFRVRIAENADLDDVLQRARVADLECLAVDTLGRTEYFDVDWKNPHLLVFGSEAHGLTERELQAIGRGIRIPMESAAESLNLAVAAGIVLFEARRQIIVE
jgi:RNA methyltransferase, TrmH family